MRYDRDCNAQGRNRYYDDFHAAIAAIGRESEQTLDPIHSRTPWLVAKASVYWLRLKFKILPQAAWRA
jgi:hypothetical protein